MGYATIESYGVLYLFVCFFSFGVREKQEEKEAQIS